MDCHQFPPLELAGCTRFAHAELTSPLARLAADEILDELTDADKASIRQRAQAGFTAIEYD